MPIALERGNGMGGSGFIQGIGCIPIYESPEIQPEGRKLNRPSPPLEAEMEKAAHSESSSSSSSSIGKNSQSSASEGEDLSGEKEVESAYKGPMDTLESLEESLPIRRGISNFYRGKSKSFASLADAMASCASAKDLGKPENAYTRKRRNLLASKTFWVKPSSNLLRSSGGGISKKPPICSRSTLALAMAMSNSKSSEEELEQQHHLLPPLHPPGDRSAAGYSPVGSSSPQYCSFPMKSFSLSDLQGMAGSGSSIGPRDKHKRFY